MVVDLVPVAVLIEAEVAAAGMNGAVVQLVEIYLVEVVTPPPEAAGLNIRRRAMTLDQSIIQVTFKRIGELRLIKSLVNTCA